MKKKTIKNNPLPVSVTVKILGKIYSSTGDTVQAALSKLKPQNPKGRCIMAVTTEAGTKERVFMPAITNRLFSSHGLTREVALKNISLLFT